MPTSATSASRSKRVARDDTDGLVPRHRRLLLPRADRGHDVDGRADLYSLGAVLFHCLAGQPPTGEKRSSPCSRRTCATRRPRSPARPDLPAALDACSRPLWRSSRTSATRAGRSSRSRSERRLPVRTPPRRGLRQRSPCPRRRGADGGANGGAASSIAASRRVVAGALAAVLLGVGGIAAGLLATHSPPPAPSTTVATSNSGRSSTGSRTFSRSPPMAGKRSVAALNAGLRRAGSRHARRTAIAASARTDRASSISSSGCQR